MEQFSEAWAAAGAAFKSGDLHADLAPVKWGLTAFLGGNEPGRDGKVIVKLREIIDRRARQIATDQGVALHEAKGRAIAQYAGTTAAGKNARAAMLKMLYHLYMGGSTKSQVVWVYSPPKVYSKWIFSVVKNLTTDAALAAELGKDDEAVYSPSQRATITKAVQTGKDLCLNAAARTARSNDITLDLVRNYFSTNATADRQLSTVASRLAKGFQLMAGMLNRGVVVISDEPKDRQAGGWSDFAFAYVGEDMCVIYVQGAMLAKIDDYNGGDQRSLIRAARTVVHETSHKVLHTSDVIYGSSGGLRPEGSADLTPEFAMSNADSWAYFCVELNGRLRPGAMARARTAAGAIRAAPSRALLV